MVLGALEFLPKSGGERAGIRERTARGSGAGARRHRDSVSSDFGGHHSGVLASQGPRPTVPTSSLALADQARHDLIPGT